MGSGFTRHHLNALQATKYLRLRAGPDHRFIAVWVVVVEGRAFVRSWNDKPTGWYRAFRDTPTGAIWLNGADVPVKARTVPGHRLLDAITKAYAAKYTTKANRPYVEGFADPARRSATLELAPA